MDTAADDAARRARSARFATMPIVLAGTIAVTAGLTGPVAHAEEHHDDGADHRRHVDQDRPVDGARSIGQDRNLGHRAVFGTAVAAPTKQPATTVAATRSNVPATVTVRQGDTVSGIAARYGLSAQEVLLRNGLSWNTIIHPGQSLRLTTTPHTPAPAAAPASTTAASAAGKTYHVRSGDTVSGIAARSGVSTTALLQANRLQRSSVIYPGQTLRVPSAASSPAPSAPAPAATSTGAAAPSPGRVTIRTGDTIATLAAAHRVSVQALLSANGLSYTSTIYAGKTLVLPGGTAGGAPAATSGRVTSAPGASTGSATVSLSAEQRANAATIVAVGRSLGVPQQGIVVALAAAMQESSLRNLAHGDRDSVGLFQQRPSQGWGSAAQLRDPRYAARAFFEGIPGKTRGLLGVPGWSRMSVTDAAQAVQISAYPKAYATWAGPAATWLAGL